MRHWISTTTLAATLLTAGLGAHAAGLGDNLRPSIPSLGSAGSAEKSSNTALSGLLGHGTGNMLGSLGVPAADSASNAAGVITYCLKNNYIDANKAKAEQMKNELLGKVGLKKQETPKDQGYLSGLAGNITGSNGQAFSLDKLQADLKAKACDWVLDNAQSLL